MTLTSISRKGVRLNLIGGMTLLEAESALKSTHHLKYRAGALYLEQGKNRLKTYAALRKAAQEYNL